MAENGRAARARAQVHDITYLECIFTAAMG